MFLVVNAGALTGIGMFLSVEELIILTGRKTRSKQVEALRQMGLPFFVNALGRPVVARATVEGKSSPSQARVRVDGWQPRVLAG